MNISVKGDYALHALFDLALNTSGEPVKIAEIARRQKIPQKFLELILASLKQGGFVESRRGADGGYMLSKAPESITVGQVLHYVESSRAGRSVKRARESPFARMWSEVDAAVSEVVDKTTFGDLAREWRERQGRYVPNWDI
jgi:Rrf2 family protein